MKKHGLLLFLGMSLLATSCNKSDDDPKTDTTIEPKTTQFDVPVMGGTTYFSFAEGGKVPASDSATTNWDFGMKFYHFYINSHTSGPGNAGVIVVNTAFDEVIIAPENGYQYDTSSTQRAVGNDWFDYNSTDHSFTPKAGITFIFRTAENKYAKMEMLEAIPLDANGEVVTPPAMPMQIRYKIRYSYQPDATREF